MILTAELPGTVRQLIQAPGSGLFAVVGGNSGGLVVVDDDGYRLLYKGDVISGAASHDGNLFFTVRGSGGIRIWSHFATDVLGGKKDAVADAEGSWRPGPSLPTEQSWGSASDLNGCLIVAGGAHWSEFHGRYIFDDAVYAYREGSFE